MKNSLRWAVAAVTFLAATHASAQLYTFNGGVVSEYNSATGALIQGSLITNTHYDENQIVIEGGDIYIPQYIGGSTQVASYNATTGALIGNPYITGIHTGPGVVTANSTEFFSANAGNDIEDYTLSTGAVLNQYWIYTGEPITTLTASATVLYANLNDSSLVAYNISTGGLQSGFTTVSLSGALIGGMVVYGNDLFVENNTTHDIAEYNATTGALITSDFYTGTAAATFNSLNVVGTELYVGAYTSTSNLTKVAVISTATANTVYDATLDTITGNDDITVAPGSASYVYVPPVLAAPEPRSWAFALLAFGAFGLLWNRRQSLG